MKSIITVLLVCLCSLEAMSQCDAVGIQVSSSSETTVQLYHAGFFLIPQGFDNVIDWEVQDFDGNIVHEETTSGVWADQSFVFFDHSVPTTDSIAVKITIVNETSGITCVVNDTLAYISPIIEWMPVGNNTGVETNVLGIIWVNSIFVSCFNGDDGTIEVQGLNGSPPYMYSIDGGLFGANPLFTGLSAGEYTISVSDSEGSTSSITLPIEEPVELLLETAAGDVSCFGSNDGIIVSEASGGTFGLGYQYFIDGDGPSDTGTFSDLSAGSYLVSVQDGNECITTVTVEILQPDEITAEEIVVNNTSCESEVDGGIDFVVMGGTAPFTFTIDGLEPTTDLPISGLAVGQYTMTIEDDASCSSTFDFEIVSPEEILVSIEEISNADCINENSGSVIVSASGGAGEFEFSLGNQANDTGVFEGLAAGLYMIAITDTNGCSIDTAITIDLDPDFDVSYDVTDIVCSGDSSGTITVLVEGGNEGFIFFLNEEEMDGAMFSNLAAGEYAIMVEGVNGCSALTTVSVNSPPPLFLDSLTQENVNCTTGSLGSVIITGLGGSGDYTFSLDSTTNSTGVFEGLEAGVYGISVTDSVGCVSALSVLILQEGEINGEISEVQDISCNGSQDGMVTINVNNPNEEYQYYLDSLTNDTGIFTDLNSGGYLATIISGAGCVLNLEFEIQNVEVLEVELDEFVDDDGSGNGAITVSASGGTEPYQYSIDDGASFQSEPVFTDLTNDEYSILVLDANGCEETISVIITLTDIEELENITNLKLYPNPSVAGNGITISSDVRIASITLLNGNGQFIESRNYNANEVNFSTNGLARGLYTLGIITAEGNIWRKVVITN